MLADTTDEREGRLRNAGTVVSYELKRPDNIPQDLLDKAMGVPGVFSETNHPVMTGGKYRWVPLGLRNKRIRQPSVTRTSCSTLSFNSLRV